MAAQVNGESQMRSQHISNPNDRPSTTNGTLKSQSDPEGSFTSNVDNIEQTHQPSGAQPTNAFQSSNGLADFFSPEVFRIVLHNPTTAHRLLKFSQARMCGENMEFLEKVDRYNALLDELMTVMTEIHHTYTSIEAPKQIGIPSAMLKRLNTEIKESTTNTIPAMEGTFGEAQENVEQILRSAVYPRFVKYQMTNNASQALSRDRSKYQGLGDCFCLTDPHKADNPIVFASDGFVSVTGYSRSEIVPRNCRFLQGTYTDRTATTRLRASIEAKEETVELLLNYKKSGEPFWNLLYVAPLYDSNGRLTFFIGGQINCSTTIRSNTDVLRILSASDDPDEAKEVTESIRSVPSRKRSIFGFGKKESTPKLPQSTKKVEVREAGMEQGLLKQIGKMDFRTQMEKFYTAYSKYLVLRYSDYTIQHFSEGIVEALGISVRNNQDFLCADVFKFLAQHTTSMPREFKNKVKTALKSGQAISASINLLTMRSLTTSRSDDKFFTHWTPTKDEHGAIKYVVLTMSSTLFD